MNKIFMLSAAVLALTLGAGMAFAEDGAPEKGRGLGHGPRPGKEMALHFFKQMDTNGDKLVSKEEFLKHAEDRFAKMDLDGNGEVTIEEAKEAHEKMREERQERMEEMRGKRGPAPDDAE